MLPDKAIVIEHLRGTRTDFTDLPSFQRRAFDVVKLPGARVHYMMAEMPMAECLPLLPPSLSPSIPAHLTITSYDIPESPVGGFSLCIASVGCRSGIRPRMFTTRAFVTTPEARDMLWTHCGIRTERAEVTNDFMYHATATTVRLGSEVILEGRTHSAEPIISAGAAVKFCPPLNPVSMDGKTGLIQSDMSFTYDYTERGTIEFGTFDAKALGLGRERPTFMVCGVMCKVGMEISPSTMFLDMVQRPGEDGVHRFEAA